MVKLRESYSEMFDGKTGSFILRVDGDAGVEQHRRMQVVNGWGERGGERMKGSQREWVRRAEGCGVAGALSQLPRQ